MLEESSVGAIVTSGNPDGLVDNSLAGVDFRYLNTRLGEGRVLEGTAWYQKTETEGLEGDDSAYGLGIAMPNSQGWKGELEFKTLEENYFPALGFASRTDITVNRAEVGYTWRPGGSWIRSIQAGINGEFVNAINGRDQSNQVELNAVTIENQAADSLELNHYLVEERLTEPFEISDGIVIPAGTYTFDHACATLVTGQQRALATESTICGGEFYDGRIFVFETINTWRPSPHLKVVLGGEYNDVDLPQGDFITRLVRLNVGHGLQHGLVLGELYPVRQRLRDGRAQQHPALDPAGGPRDGARHQLPDGGLRPGPPLPVLHGGHDAEAELHVQVLTIRRDCRRRSRPPRR